MFSPLVRAIFVSTLVLVTWWIPAVFFPADSLNEAISSLLLIAAGVGVWRWGPTAWRVFRRGAQKPHEQGILAIVILLLALSGQRIWSVSYVRLGRPEWMVGNPITGFFVYLILVSAILFSVSTRYDGEESSRLGKWVIGAFTATALIMSSAWPVIVSKIGMLISFLSHVLPK